MSDKKINIEINDVFKKLIKEIISSSAKNGSKQ